jgi:Heparinase II/III-like protein
MRFWIFVLPFVIASTARAATPDVVDPTRVDEIAAELSDQPFAFGPSIDDRAAWAKLAAEPALRGIPAEAEKLIDKPIKPLPDDLYLEFSRTGNRDRYEALYYDRMSRLMPLVMAECIEDRGRYLPAIRLLAEAICSQKSWTLPAHDGKLLVFSGKQYDIELVSSALACDWAEAVHLLGDHLDRPTRFLILSNIRRRVLEPFVGMITGRRDQDFFLHIQNNWNAVCLANVVGAGLDVLPSRHDRALFAAAAEHYSIHYLEGVSPDGYCLEGLGYWNYGYVHYMQLSEELWRATDGRLDLFHRDKVEDLATYPQRFEIVNGIYPPYGDVHQGTRPWLPLLDFAERKFVLPLTANAQNADSGARVPGLTEALMFYFPNSTTGTGSSQFHHQPLYDWFPDANVLACRPEPLSGSQFAVSIKGGHNGVNHGHDDLGSFVLVLGKELLLTDPGTEIYTARTFSKDRFKSNVINSFGHNVPLVNGQLQGSTKDCEAKILRIHFSDVADSVEMDLTSAYAVPALRELRRTFVFSRQDVGALTITDNAQFSDPSQTFGIGFITLGQWKQLGPNAILVWQNHEGVKIDLNSGGSPLTITAQTIEENLPDHLRPTRIGVDFSAPSDRFALKTTITPAEAVN